jgi:hypothetical protein
VRAVWCILKYSAVATPLRGLGRQPSRLAAADPAPAPRSLVDAGVAEPRVDVDERTSV